MKNLLHSTNPFEIEGLEVVAVVKHQPIEKIINFCQTYPGTGRINLGENFLQQAQEHQDELKKNLIPELYNRIRWHYIGRIQSKKIRDICQSFDAVQSIESIDHANKIQSRLNAAGKQIDAWIQVNIANEFTKAGVLQEDLQDVIDAVILLPDINLKGLMMMPPIQKTNGVLQEQWLNMSAELFTSTQRQFPDVMTSLSLGTSTDWQQAVKAGSTMIRLGSRLLGER